MTYKSKLTHSAPELLLGDLREGAYDGDLALTLLGLEELLLLGKARQVLVGVEA